MAALHFTAAEPYRQRVLQMGEAPTDTFMTGALAAARRQAEDDRKETDAHATAETTLRQARRDLARREERYAKAFKASSLDSFISTIGSG